MASCILCAETIAEAAVRCRHCGDYQGRWFFLNMSVPVLGLLVALASVLSFTVPMLVRTFSRPSSDVRISFQYFEDGTAFLVATNGGDRPGSIGDAWLDDASTHARYALAADPSSRYVAPGSSRQVAFRLPCLRDSGPQTHYAASDGWGSRLVSDDTRLHVVVVQFNGRSEVVDVPIGALSGVQVVADRQARCVADELAGPTEPRIGPPARGERSSRTTAAPDRP